MQFGDELHRYPHPIATNEVFPIAGEGETLYDQLPRIVAQARAHSLAYGCRYSVGTYYDRTMNRRYLCMVAQYPIEQ